ncbi:hypothetical protein I79_001905 [Cricetulus griseus]|uniref:Uncharacterized protein n=1 Tax=Cricetulus griseus TaxID=10029 RepID=G3GVZ9_CRIGR|nr:hypothetical protein I79_001905 [Cricetulus griseus]
MKASPTPQGQPIWRGFLSRPGRQSTRDNLEKVSLWAQSLVDKVEKSISFAVP